MKGSGNLLVLTVWSYEDALIQGYTLPYVRMIRKQLNGGERLMLVTFERSRNVHTLGQSFRHRLKLDGIDWIHFPYRPLSPMALILWIYATIRLVFVILKNRIDTLHCWCTPAGALGYILSVACRCRLVLDSFEPHAEAMIETGTWNRGDFAFRVLFWLEKKQAQRAAIVIAANLGMGTYALNKFGVDLGSYFTKPACINLSEFKFERESSARLAAELRIQDKIVCVCAGKFGGLYLDKEVFEFIKVAIDRWGDRFRFLLLGNHLNAEIEKYCSEAHVDSRYIIKLPVPYQEMPQYLSIATFALNPMKPVPSRRYCTPIKDGEYWAMGLPVVIADGISDDSEIIRNEGIGAVLDHLDAESYDGALDAIELLLAQPKDQLQMKIREVASKFRNYSIAENVYRKIYGR